VNWTRKEENTLEALRLDGKSVLEICEVLGRTWQSVRGRLRKLECIKPSGYIKYLPYITVPHDRQVLAERLGVTVHAVKKAKISLESRGFVVYKDKPGPKALK
jgi:Mn-dependent DtxR family transcriptional regulator